MTIPLFFCDLEQDLLYVPDIYRPFLYHIPPFLLLFGQIGFLSGLQLGTKNNDKLTAWLTSIFYLVKVLLQVLFISALCNPSTGVGMTVSGLRNRAVGIEHRCLCSIPAAMCIVPALSDSLISNPATLFLNQLLLPPLYLRIMSQKTGSTQMLLMADNAHVTRLASSSVLRLAAAMLSRKKTSVRITANLHIFQQRASRQSIKRRASVLPKTLTVIIYILISPVCNSLDVNLSGLCPIFDFVLRFYHSLNLDCFLPLAFIRISLL